MRNFRNEIYAKGMLHLIRLALLMLAVVFAAGTVSHVAASTGMAIAMAVEADMADGMAGECTLCAGTSKAATASCDLLCNAPVVASLPAAIANFAVVIPVMFGFPADQKSDGLDTRMDPRPPRTILSV